MKSIINIAKQLLSPSIGVALIILAYNSFDESQINEIKNQFSVANYNYIYLSLFFAFIGYVVRAYRWVMIMDNFGFKLPFKNSMIAVCASYLVNLTIPRSGEITRAGIILKTDNIPFQRGFNSIIIERIIDVFILLSITFLALILETEQIISLLNIKKIDFNFFNISIIVICLAVSLFVIFKFVKLKFITIIKKYIIQFKDDFISIKKLKNKSAFIFQTVLIWLSYYFMFYVTIFTFPETANLSATAVLTAFVAGSFAVALTNGGFGAYPILIAKALLLYNIPETIGTSFGWIVWTSQIIFAIILGTISFIALPFVNKSK